MDLERVRDFSLMIENLGNPNDIVREKHTTDLLRTIEANPVESLMMTSCILFSPGELAKKKAAAIIASNISRSLTVDRVEASGAVDTLEKLLIDIFKLVSEETDPVIRSKACSAYACIFHVTCGIKPNNRLEYFSNVPTLLANRNEVFFSITEELIQTGFFFEVDKSYLKKISGCLKDHLTQSRELQGHERVARLLAKFAEVMEDDILCFSELTQVLFGAFQASCVGSPEVAAAFPDSQDSKRRADFIEAIDLLTDFGPKLFKNSLGMYILQAHKSLQVSQPLNISHLLRLVVLNFSYELPRRIQANAEVLNAFIISIVSGLVN